MGRRSAPATPCSSSVEAVSWLQLSVAVDRDRADATAELLEAGGAAAVTLCGADAEALLEPAPGARPLWRRVRLLALLDPGADLAALRRHLAAAGAHLDDVTFVAEADWTTRWRSGSARGRFGNRLWLVPRDEPFQPPTASAVVMRLDPGLGFGSGSHPTTRLCLAGLAEWPLAGTRVLDYGCGSGILAIAASLLGAEAVWAVDHDPQALLATRDNAAYNAVPECRLEVVAPEHLPEPDDEAGAFDMVVANILANPLMELAPRLTGLLRRDGRLMLCGLLAGQMRRVVDAYPGVAFAAEPVREAEWIRLDGRRRA